MIADLSCPLSVSGCRHASRNFEPVRIPRFKVVGGLQVPAGEQVELRPDPRGVYCNDLQKYSGEIDVCPHHPPVPPRALSTTHQPGQQKIGEWLT